MSHLTKHIYSSHRTRPAGIFHGDEFKHTGVPNGSWFREEPEDAAELFALELGIDQLGTFEIVVIDDSGGEFTFTFKVTRELVARRPSQ
jgi:hypothetical protein